jgi:hypothetical protein
MVLLKRKDLVGSFGKAVFRAILGRASSDWLSKVWPPSLTVRSHSLPFLPVRIFPLEGHAASRSRGEDQLAPMIGESGATIMAVKKQPASVRL